MEFLGHVTWKEALENLRVTGKIENRRMRGRPREIFMDGLVQSGCCR